MHASALEAESPTISLQATQCIFLAIGLLLVLFLLVIFGILFHSVRKGNKFIQNNTSHPVKQSEPEKISWTVSNGLSKAYNSPVSVLYPVHANCYETPSNTESGSDTGLTSLPNGQYQFPPKKNVVQHSHSLKWNEPLKKTLRGSRVQGLRNLNHNCTGCRTCNRTGICSSSSIPILRKRHKVRRTKRIPWTSNSSPIRNLGWIKPTDANKVIIPAISSMPSIADSQNRRIVNMSYTSGSGSGPPLLVQQTIARQIQLLDCIGTGRFGEVWRGKYEGEDVAVKIFSSRDEASWVRETAIFTNFSLRHENLLGYLASDITSRNGSTQLWLVLEFHRAGSLYDHLQQWAIDIPFALRLARSIANGLCYLHSVISGIYEKPAISHRDIKSKNILIKANGTCCIADLGLAVVQPQRGFSFRCTNYKVGTKRYMAPEVLHYICQTNFRVDTEEEDLNPLPSPLCQSCEFQSSNTPSCTTDEDDEAMKGTPQTLDAPTAPTFASLLAADVYAFGLVLWEIVLRCKLNKADVPESHALPYANIVGPDPTYNVMHQVVGVRRIRPFILSKWTNDKRLSRCIQVMTESWHPDPAVRLTMLRVKKTLKSLFSDSFEPAEYRSNEANNI